MSMPVAVTEARLGSHSYGESTPYSIGVEEEFQLIHPDTYDLVQRVDEVLEQASLDDLEQIKRELMQSVVETATRVCANTAEAAADVTTLRRRVAELAANSGALIASAGTHPFARYEFQKISNVERYKQIIDRLQWIARRELIFGLHVHVGIGSPDKAMYVLNHIRAYLPELLALSANSPFWQGRATGLQSSRSKIFDSFPRSGLPPTFASYAEWDALMHRSARLGVLEDYTFIWWDARLHPKFGTVEIRVCDAQTRVSDSLALAALIQGVCAWLGEQYDLGVQRDIPPLMLVGENKWNAARYGLDGEFIDFETDTVIPTLEAVSRLIERAAPYMNDLGSAEEFAALDSLLIRNGATRQLDCHAETGSLVSVGRMLANESRVV